MSRSPVAFSTHCQSFLLLAPEAQVQGLLVGVVAAKRIDVDAAATLIARLDTQFFRAAAVQDVEEHSFDAGLVKIIVLAKGNDVAQQRGTIDFRPKIADLHAAGVRLRGDRAETSQRMRVQVFSHPVGAVSTE